MGQVPNKMGSGVTQANGDYPISTVNRGISCMVMRDAFTKKGIRNWFPDAPTEFHIQAFSGRQDQ